MSSQIPEHVSAERHRSRLWAAATSATALAVWGTTIALGPLIQWLLGEPLDRYTVEGAGRYLAGLWPNPWTQAVEWYWGAQGIGSEAAMGWTGGGFVLAGLTAVGLHRANPYRAGYMIHGDARFAGPRDLAAMDRGRQIGPSGTYLHLGNFHGRPVRLIETLAVTSIAPPGTGKTARFIVPSVLSTDGASLILHDPKPELWDICSGYRATLGPCLRLDWSANDNPAEDEWNPMFNFLDPRVIPPPGGRRDTLFDSLGKILVPDKEGGKGGDDYFVQQGRSALVGLMHFLVAKMNDRRDDARYENLPARWHGKPASLPMLVDWLMESQLANEGGGGGPEADPMKPYFEGLVREAREWGYPDRCLRDLQPLINMADKERSGVLGSMNAGILPFRNESVVERTAMSDFVPTDLRGVLRPEALSRLGLEAMPADREEWDSVRDRLRPEDWQPVTVMACINQVDAEAFEAVTALFFTLCSRTLLAYGPNEVTPNGTILGPYPVGFLMDEMVKMARCDAVMDGPDLGRSKKCFYVFVAQAIAQFERRYSKEQRNTIMSTAAVRYLLAQNDAETIQEIAKVVGSTTVRRKTLSRQVGMSKQANPMAGQQSEQLDKVELINQQTLASMKPNTHMLVVQNFLPRPILADSPLYFRDPVLSKRAWNPRLPPERNLYKPAVPLPERMASVKRRRWRDEEAAREIRENTDLLRYRLDLEHFAATPALSP